jgi:hypothetical protein
MLALARLDGEDNAAELPLADVVIGGLGELAMPELLTTVHGRGLWDPAPKLPGCGDGIELVERVNPPPSKVGSAAVPSFPVEHGPGFAFPEYAGVTPCGSVARPPRPIPSGDAGRHRTGLRRAFAGAKRDAEHCGCYEKSFHLNLHRSSADQPQRRSSGMHCCLDNLKRG